ncbi:hypothetical protein F5877DRAFT_86701 [Lentinula edodes]|nr:hypothetical protein F5877DRAFT_86701 [Lentinula edodes]
MSLPSSSAVTGAPNPVLPPVSSSSHPHSTEMTVDAAIDELANTLEEPPLGQLALFRSVFGVGVSLARYIVDDPLWLLLAAAGLPCSFLTATTRSPAFWVGLPAFVIFHWRDIAAKIEASTNSTVALIELNSLDEQDQQELDHLAFCCGNSTRFGEKEKKRPVREVSEPEVAPEVHDRKRKRLVGESRDAEVPDYRRVVLVLRPPLVDPSGSAYAYFHS